MVETIIVKLGGSVITFKDKPFTEDIVTIRRICKEIAEALKQKPMRLIVAHGGGSYPHVPAKKYKMREGITSSDSIRGFVETQYWASALNKIIVKELLDAGVNALSIQPSASVMMKDDEIIKMDTAVMKDILDYGVIAVPFGDVVVDAGKGIDIASTEKIIKYLTNNFHVDRIILCGSVDGVFTNDPKTHSDAKLIDVITPVTYQKVMGGFGSSYGIDVTGGMFTKIKDMVELVSHYPHLRISVISARHDGNLTKALLNEKLVCTEILPNTEEAKKLVVADINGVMVHKDFKPWICYLGELNRRGVIEDEKWKVLSEQISLYKRGIVTRERALHIITNMYGAYVAGTEQSKLLEAAKACMPEIRTHYNNKVVDAIKNNKDKCFVHYITGNFWEIAKFVAEDLFADSFDAVKLQVDSEGKVTGNFENRYMTAEGKRVCFKEIRRLYHVPVDKLCVVGDDPTDWMMLSTEWLSLLCEPDLSISPSMSEEEKNWVKEIKKWKEKKHGNISVVSVDELPMMLSKFISG